MMTRVYTLRNGQKLEDVAKKIENMLSNDNMIVQCIEMTDGNFLIQGKEMGLDMIAKITGGERAVTVKLTSIVENKIFIEIGEGRWLDKFIGGLWGLTFWPAMACTVITTYRQVTLPRKIMRCVENDL